MTQKAYSFLQEISNITPTRNSESEVGDPIGGVDQETESTRRKAKALKAQAELLSAGALLKKTKYDVQKMNQQIEADQQEQANAEADKQRQAQQQAMAQQQAQNQATNINQYVNQQVGNVQQDPTVDPNVQ